LIGGLGIELGVELETALAVELGTALAV